MAKEIPLAARKEVALVDNEDYEELIQFNWLMHSFGYATRRGEFRSVMMHRQIMDAPDDLVVDHRNGNRLDNRRENLRICTQGENAKNKHRRGENGLSYQPRLLSLRLSAEEAIVLDELSVMMHGRTGADLLRCALHRLAREEGLVWPRNRRRRENRK